MLFRVCAATKIVVGIGTNLAEQHRYRYIYLDSYCTHILNLPLPWDDMYYNNRRETQRN